MLKDLALSAIVAGFVAVLVGYTSSVAIVFQAAAALGATQAQAVSWMWALGLGMGLTSAGLSLAYRRPVLTAWSTPGAALLVNIGTAQATAMKDEGSREAAVMTFIVSASGLALWGVGSAFWGVVAGALALLLTRWKR